jgi:hypothetical protein
MSSGAVGSSMNLQMDVSTLSHKKRSVCLPGLNGLDFLHVLDCLRDIPHLVGIDHEHRAGWTRVLPLELTTVGITAVGAGWEVLRVVDDRADDQSTAEIRFDICSNFHFEVIKTSSDGLFREPRNLLIRIAYMFIEGSIELRFARLSIVPSQPTEVT